MRGRVGDVGTSKREGGEGLGGTHKAFTRHKYLE